MCNKNMTSYKNELENDKNRKTPIPTETSTANSKFFPFAVQNFGTLDQTSMVNKQTISFIMGISGDSLHVY